MGCFMRILRFFKEIDLATDFTDQIGPGDERDLKENSDEDQEVALNQAGIKHSPH